MTGNQSLPPVPPLVLVVDDEAPLRRVIGRALERAGYCVRGAGSAESAYELLATTPADAVLLDVQLPTMSGLALYLAIIRRWPALTGRVAIMSGDADAEDVQNWVAHNPCVVLRKPFRLDEVLRWLRHVMEQRQRGEANA